MDGASPSGMILVFLWMLLPAAAIFLSVLAAILALIPITRRFSLAAAFGCLVIYAALVIQMNLVGATDQHDVEVLNSLPGGKLFRSFLLFFVAVIVACFDIYVLKRDRRKKQLTVKKSL